MSFASDWGGGGGGGDWTLTWLEQTWWWQQEYCMSRCPGGGGGGGGKLDTHLVGADLVVAAGVLYVVLSVGFVGDSGKLMWSGISCSRHNILQEKKINYEIISIDSMFFKIIKLYRGNIWYQGTLLSNFWMTVIQNKVIKKLIDMHFWFCWPLMKKSDLRIYKDTDLESSARETLHAGLPHLSPFKIPWHFPDKIRVFSGNLLYFILTVINGNGHTPTILERQKLKSNNQ